MTKQTFNLDDAGQLTELFEALEHRQEERDSEKEHEHEASLLEGAAEMIENLCEKALEKIDATFTPASHSFGAPAPSCH